MDGGISTAQDDARLLAAEMATQRVMMDMSEAICIALARDKGRALQVLDLYLTEYAREMPDFGGYASLSSMRDDAAFWADFATDTALAAMAEACISRLEREGRGQQHHGRLLVAIWNAMAPDRRRAFLDRVATKDPKHR